MTCASEAFNELMIKLGQQHESFLREACDYAFEALKAENRRLTQELGLLRAAAGARVGKLKEMKLPAVDKSPTVALVAAQADMVSYPSIHVPEPAIDYTGKVQPQLQAEESHEQGPPPPPRPQLLEPAWRPPHLVLQDEEVLPTATEASQSVRPTGSRPATGTATGMTTSTSWRTADRPYVGPESEMFKQALWERRHHKEMKGTPSSNSSPSKRPGHVTFFGWMKDHRKPDVQPPVRRTIISELDDRFHSRQLRRMNMLFGLEGFDDVTVEHLHEVLSERTAFLNMSHGTLDRVMTQFKAIPSRLPAHSVVQITDDSPEGCINLDALAQIVALPNLLAFVDEEEVRNVQRVVQLLNVTTVGEAIEDATRLSVASAIAAPSLLATWEARMAVLVGVVTLLNVFTMGVSVDHSPSSPIWFLFDIFCTMVFAAEIILKMCKWGCRGYFSGEEGRWNMLDFSTTLISSLESIVYGFVVINHPRLQAANVTRIILFLRVLRVVRLGRLMLVHGAGMMKDLAKMMVGFIIGLPSLTWVLLLFLFVLYCVGLTFRLCFGPAEGQNYIEQCGLPDSMTDYDSKDCPVHYMYGEEFFGTMSLAMFTTFRFMIGDYSTRQGNSVIVAFSYGYGMMFDSIFVTFMIVVIFGFFNIITAIFVDSTTTGLKLTDTKKKLTKQYERTYVKEKLKLLIARIQEAVAECLANDTAMGPKRSHEHGKVTEHDFQLTPREFMYIMRDAEIRTLLEDLDVEIFNIDGLFDTFDPDNNGVITVATLVQGVMRLRGDPQKNDVVGAWVAVRSLTHRFEKFHLENIEAMRRLEANQTKLEGVLNETRKSLAEGRDPLSQVLAAAVKPYSLVPTSPAPRMR